MRSKTGRATARSTSFVTVPGGREIAITLTSASATMPIVFARRRRRVVPASSTASSSSIDREPIGAMLAAAALDRAARPSSVRVAERFAERGAKRELIGACVGRARRGAARAPCSAAYRAIMPVRPTIAASPKSVTTARPARSIKHVVGFEVEVDEAAPWTYARPRPAAMNTATISRGVRGVASHSRSVVPAMNSMHR